jgi:hypothetical protein
MRHFEENRLIAKKRMYEIYLNIIEWGPGIRGAQVGAVSRRMPNREMIGREDFDSLIPDIRLRGPARLYRDAGRHGAGAPPG